METQARRLFPTLVLAALFSAPLAARASEDLTDASRATAVISESDGFREQLPPKRLTIAPARNRLGSAGFLLGAGLGLGSASLLLGYNDIDPRALVVVGGLGGIAGAIGGSVTSRSNGRAELQLGDRMRVGGTNPVKGRFSRIDSSGIVLRLADGSERVVPLESPAIQVRRTTRLIVPGASSGAVLGGALGLLVAAVGEVNRREGAVVIGVGALGGAALGAGLGAIFASNDWRSVSAEADSPTASTTNPKSRLSFALGPARDRGVRGHVSYQWR